LQGRSNWGGLAAQALAHDNAMNEIRNAAAVAGGNTALPTVERSGFSGTRMIADAFKCG
jgi:hypothetical protein